MSLPHEVQHPEMDYPGCDILVFRERPGRLPDGRRHARNAVVMSNNRLDWSRPETWTPPLRKAKPPQPSLRNTARP